MFATGLHDGTVHIWATDPESLLEAGEGGGDAMSMSKAKHEFKFGDLKKLEEEGEEGEKEKQKEFEQGRNCDSPVSFNTITGTHVWTAEPHRLGRVIGHHARRDSYGLDGRTLVSSRSSTTG
jgi:hypothetical protein